MKLAAIYNVWDGDELLEGSINQIKDLVDEIILVWQDVSNFGEQYTPNIFHIKADFVKYEPQKLSAFNNETLKRQLGIERAKELGCTHFVLMDCDEYYRKEDFAWAKQYVEEQDLDGTVVKLVTYYKNPSWRLEDKEGYYVPFIHKLHPYTCCGSKSYPFWCDPTRGINTKQVRELSEHAIVMHHYSWIRKNIERKLNNSSAKQNFSNKIRKFIEEFDAAKLGDTVSYYQKKLVETENIFGIEI